MFFFKIKKMIITFSGICICVFAFGQASISFQSSDKALEDAFIWAKNTALNYKGDQNDVVGPWYEAALPQRDAFCIRDVSHQCIGAEILGMSRENKNMISKFVSHISESKNWCSYWEINKWNKPAPVDYKNDREFWYNLNANFDLIYACRRLYQWTGNKSYINDPVFSNFFERSLNEYVKEWVLEADSLLTRPSLPNSPVPFNKNNMFHTSHGLPSYIENIPDLKMSADLIAAIYQGFTSYSLILKENGSDAQSTSYAQIAAKYKEHFESKWWDTAKEHYYTHYTGDGKFGNEGADVFLLWFNMLNDSIKRNSVVEDLISADLNVETMSYLPYLLYLNGYLDQAYRYILHLSDPNTKRREYPEVSFGVIEGIIQGLMGIDPDARSGTISTIFRGKAQIEVTADDVPVLNSAIKVQHFGSGKTLYMNKGSFPMNWIAGFAGKHSSINVDGKPVKASFDKGSDGKVFSFVNIVVQTGQQVNASVQRTE